jgi:hypothetical protein
MVVCVLPGEQVDHDISPGCLCGDDRIAAQAGELEAMR